MPAVPSLRRVDLRFVLPATPARAVLLGDPAGWSDGLAEAGVAVVEVGGDADLAVAPARLARAAVETDAPVVLLEGWSPAATRALRAGGYPSRRLLTLPRPAAAQLVVDPRSRHAAADAGRRLPRVGRLAGPAFGTGLAPAALPGVTVGARRPGPPALLAAAQELGALPAAEWCLLLGSGGVRKRAAFLLYPAGERRPAQVVKFTRLAGNDAAFAREESGLRLAVQAGAVVADRVPRILGRGTAAGVPASVETAVPGVPLTRLLGSARGLAVADDVAGWLVHVARATAVPPEALAGERARLARDGARELVDLLPPVPGDIRHDDLSTDNVLVDGDRFGVVDWEQARTPALPLGDLLFFAAHALAGRDDPADLFAGRGAESPRLFRWVRGAAAALGLPAGAVGVLAALAWYEYGDRARASRLAREQATGETVPPYLAERLAAAWAARPDLGPHWSAWRERC